MKPTPEQIKRNEQMIADYEKFPRESIASIAKRNGLTRSRVHQIIHKHYRGS
jgi:hypothetical protein